MRDEELLRRIMTDFPFYLDYVYSNIGLPRSTPLQQRIASILGENPSRKILEAARGTGKSWVGAIYTTWRLLRNPDEKILVVSGSGAKAQEIATFIRRLFEDVPILTHLKPKAGQRDSILAFDIAGCKVAIAPSVSCSGITSQITGKRSSLVIADDVEILSNSMTELMREKLLNSVKEFEALLIPDMPSSIVFLGTPQSMESIYNKLEYPTSILPAQVPEDPTVYGGKLDDWVLLQGQAGEATDKVRFPDEVLLERQAGMGMAGYKLQFMLDTTLSDAERFPLKQKDIMLLPLDNKEAPATLTYSSNRECVVNIPNIGFTGDVVHKPYRVSDTLLKYDRIIMSIDPSGTGTDETTYVVLGILSGMVYVLDWGGTRKGYSEEALMFLALKAKEHQVHEIVPEKNFGAGMFTELFRKVLIKVYPCTIVEDFNVKGNKEARILDNLLPLFTNHLIIFNETTYLNELEWVQQDPVGRLQYSLVYQFTHITYDKGSIPHDDRIDALAIACQYISDMVIVDADKRLQQLKEEEFDNWLNETVYNRGSVDSRRFIGTSKVYR